MINIQKFKKENISYYRKERHKLLKYNPNNDMDFSKIDFLYLFHNKLNWNIIKTIFDNNFRFFDSFLKKIHNRRNFNYDKKANFNLIKFLTIGYIFSNDIRYLNEFFWLYKKNEKYNYFKNIVLSHFYSILDKNYYHPFPLYSRENIIKLVNNKIEYKNIYKSKIKISSPLPKIALLGPPFLFKNVYDKLKKGGLFVRIFNIPYYYEKKRNFVVSNNILLKFISFIKGFNQSYKNLDYDYKNEQLYRIF